MKPRRTPEQLKAFLKWQRDYRKNPSRHKCDCGSAATKCKQGAWVCARCDGLEELRDLHEAKRVTCGEGQAMPTFSIVLPFRGQEAILCL